MQPTVVGQFLNGRALGDASLRRHSGALPRLARIAWFAMGMGLACSHAVPREAPPEKRVEQRGEAVQTNPRPAGPAPGQTHESAPPTQPPAKCEKEPGAKSETTTVVEETTTVIQQEVVVVQVSSPAGIETDYLTVPQVLQDTIGRARVDSVVACMDPRFPLPSYAFVGIQPRIAPLSEGETVRLQRFDCELDVSGDWHPSHSLFRIWVGASAFEILVGDEEGLQMVPAVQIRGPGSYGLVAGLSRSGSLAGAARYVLSLQFPRAASGKAPLLRPGDTVFLQIAPSVVAPPTYAMPRFLLVSATPGVTSTLRLIEKSGATATLLPETLDLELAAFCNVVRRIPQ